MLNSRRQELDDAWAMIHSWYRTKFFTCTMWMFLHMLTLSTEVISTYLQEVLYLSPPRMAPLTESTQPLGPKMGRPEMATYFHHHWLAPTSTGLLHKSGLLLQMEVPQGFILTLLLFSIFINKLPYDLPTLQLNLYADDMVIFKSTHSHSPTEAHLQEDLNSLNVWIITTN